MYFYLIMSDISFNFISMKIERQATNFKLSIPIITNKFHFKSHQMKRKLKISKPHESIKLTYIWQKDKSTIIVEHSKDIQGGNLLEQQNIVNLYGIVN